MQSTEKREEIFNDIYSGDIVVSLEFREVHREIGDIFRVLSISSLNKLWYEGRHEVIYCTAENSFRKATSQEEQWYKSTFKGEVLNIRDMPKEIIINNYQIY
jgi:hypothetical protein